MSSRVVRPPGLADGTETIPMFSSTSKTTKSKAATAGPPTKSKTAMTGQSRGGNISKSSKGVAKSVPKGKSKSRPRAEPQTAPVQNRIKVGVDFGTTNSGVAHVVTFGYDAQNVEVIKSWPGGQRAFEQLEKVPSQIALKSENDSIDEDRWGYDVQPGMKSYTWFKLHLDADAARSIFDSAELSGNVGSVWRKLPDNMTAEEVTTAYLSKLYSHSMRELGRRHMTNVLEVTPIDFWLTVPATWQDSAVEATREAAREAGFCSREGDTLSIITEPEAAAIAALSGATDKARELIKKNVLICDLGGGTLDFQVLTIDKVVPCLEMTETIPGLGGKHGSVYIDCKFHEWACATFGDAFKSLSEERTGTGSQFFKDWELLKKTFNGKDLTKQHQILLPALANPLRRQNPRHASYDFEDHSIVVTGHELVQMFEPSVTTALAIVDRLIAELQDKKLAPVQVMCLVGGLGSSEYVWERFEQYNEEKFGDQCWMVKDARAWSAVVRGATLRGLHGRLVLSRVARRAYGIGIHRTFREGIDDERDAFVCPVKGKRALGYVSWPLKIGQYFRDDMRIKTNLYVTIPEDADSEDLSFTWELFSCDLVDLPDRQEHSKVKSEGIINLSLEDTSNFSSDTGHEAMKVAIVFKMGSERGTLVVEAMAGRRSVGIATIDYARTHARQVV